MKNEKWDRKKLQEKQHQRLSTKMKGKERKRKADSHREFLPLFSLSTPTGHNLLTHTSPLFKWLSVPHLPANGRKGGKIQMKGGKERKGKNLYLFLELCDLCLELWILLLQSRNLQLQSFTSSTASRAKKLLQKPERKEEKQLEWLESLDCNHLIEQGNDLYVLDWVAWLVWLFI